jgi:hypothetical protein
MDKSELSKYLRLPYANTDAVYYAALVAVRQYCAATMIGDFSVAGPSVQEDPSVQHFTRIVSAFSDILPIGDLKRLYMEVGLQDIAPASISRYDEDAQRADIIKQFGPDAVETAETPCLGGDSGRQHRPHTLSPLYHQPKPRPALSWVCNACGETIRTEVEVVQYNDAR